MPAIGAENAFSRDDAFSLSSLVVSGETSMRLRYISLLGCLLFCCCSRHHSPISCTNGQRPIENGAVAWETRNGKTWLIYWFDIPLIEATEHSYSFSSSAETGVVDMRRRQVSKDGRIIEMWARTTDGTSGDAEINRSQFKLERGEIFLIGTRGKESAVEQICGDLTGFEPTLENLDKLANTHTEIKKYLEALEKAK
jgi:hypothetical protein